MTAGNGSLALDCLYKPPLDRAEAEYLHYLGCLLDSSPRLVSQQPAKQTGKTQFGPDLLVYWEPERPFWQHWFGITPAIGVVKRTTASVLVMKHEAKKRPCWPIRRILLILRVHETDEIAIRWLDKLARATGTRLFVLPIVPSIPAMYRYGRIPLDFDIFLTANVYAKKQLRHLARLCKERGIEGNLLLQDSDPQQRIAWAMATSRCDLIILNDEPYPWFFRWVFGELVRPLLQRSTCPVLITKDYPKESSPKNFTDQKVDSASNGRIPVSNMKS